MLNCILLCVRRARYEIESCTISIDHNEMDFVVSPRCMPCINSNGLALLLLLNLMPFRMYALVRAEFNFIFAEAVGQAQCAFYLSKEVVILKFCEFRAKTNSLTQCSSERETIIIFTGNIEMLFPFAFASDCLKENSEINLVECHIFVSYTVLPLFLLQIWLKMYFRSIN